MIRRKSSARLALVLGLLAAIAVARLALPSGLRAQYFLGPQFGGSPALSSLDSRFSALDLSRRWSFRPPDEFSVQWSGYLFVDRPGLRTFTIVADDGSRLFVNRRSVIEERGQGPGTRSGQIYLDRGSHEIVLQYVQIGGAYHLEWRWGTEGEPDAEVPAWVLSPRPRRASLAIAVRWMTPVFWGLAVLAATFAIPLVGPVLVRPRRSRLRDQESAQAIPQTSRRRSLACLGLFLALAAAHTWPLATSPAQLSRNDNADTVLNEWILSWIAHQLPRDPIHLFDANIFHPERHTLAYSEPLFVQGALAAPLIWLGASPVLAYNLVLIAGLALTGWAMALVVARWTGDWPAGIAAGMLVAFNAHTLTRLPHLQAQHAEFIPFALLTLDSLLRRPRWSAALWLAVWFSLQALTSIYLLVFAAVALIVSVLVRPEDWLADRFVRVVPKLVAAAALAAVVLSPFLIAYWRLHQAGFERSLDEVAWFSASVKDYWSTPSRLHASLGTSASGSTSLFPGVTALALVGIALLPGGHPIGDRRVRMMFAVVLVAVALSFGPIVPGYAFLYSVFPPLEAIRGAARFGHLALIAVAALGGFGLALVRRRLAVRPRVAFAVSAAALMSIFIEAFVAPIAFQPFSGIAPVYRLVEQEEHAVVADLPFPPPEAIFRNAPYMLGSTLNFKPLLNGYSGFMPPSYTAHYLRLASFPSAESVQALRALGVTHAFVHVDRLPAEARGSVEALDGLRRVAGDETIVLYRVASPDAIATGAGRDRR